MTGGLLLGVLLTCIAGAQVAAPRMYLVPELHVDAKKSTARSAAQARLHVGPAGRMVLTPKFGPGHIVALDSMGRLLNWKVEVARGSEAEIRWVDRVGWTSRSMWIADPAHDQVVLIDQAGKVTRSIPHHSWLRPSWAERRKYPLFAEMQPLAVYANGDMMVLAERPRSLIDTPSFDRSLTHLFRVDRDGVIQRSIAAFDADMAPEALRRSDGRRASIAVPFSRTTHWAVSADGGRAVVVLPGMTEKDSGSFRVTSVTDKGDTVFSRRYPMPAVRISQKSIDSAVARPRGIAGHSLKEVRSALAKRIRPFHSMVDNVHVGLDHYTWVVMHVPGDSVKARDALVLDPRGHAVGWVRMPDDMKQVVVDGNHLWGVQRGNALIRMRVQQRAP